MNVCPRLILATAFALLGSGHDAFATGQDAGTKESPVTKTPSTVPRLTQIEKSRGVEHGLNMVPYVLRADDFPGDHRYALYGRWMDGRSGEAGRDIRIDETGRLLNPEGKEIDLVVGEMFLGEFAVFALVSEDQSTKAFVEITPFPIQAEGTGGCRLLVKPMDAKGQAFSITGSGFRPNKKLRIFSTSGDESAHTSAEGKADGTLKQILLPAVVGRTGGDASFEASDAACTVAVRYKWGDQMRSSMPPPGPPAN